MRGGLCLAAALVASSAWAADSLIPGAASLDRPTVVSLGVQWLVSGDDNHDAVVTLRYREAGSVEWRQGLSLFRVRPEVVDGWTVPQQFAGSLFDLRPDTSYEIELHATDADGPVDQTVSLTGRTRAVPKDPASPVVRNVATVSALQPALSAAAAGDVITLANGTYAGSFALNASGTAQNPIVIRGASRDGVILDGQGCAACNVLEVYGSYVHVERLTLKSANRALRFQGTGAIGNVVRRVRVSDTKLGFGSKVDQKDFYLCDNELEGRLAWPAVYSDDSGAHANDDGIHVEGSGHVVCHNRIVGYGDSIKTGQDGARALDFYGNEVVSAYDNDLELDGVAGNARAFRNRFTNGYAPISFQPIFGGPVYAFRNVVVNVAHEQMKFHALGVVPPQEPSGIFIFHNTFVSAAHALFLATSATSHHFVVENNLFIGPASPTSGRTVDWTGPIDNGVFDYNGWFPDAAFRFNWVGRGLTSYANLAALKADAVEVHGVLVPASPFASGLVAPTSYTATLTPPDVTLAAGSSAIDRGVVLPAVNEGYTGTAPDLGALERDCPLPIFGVRPEGTDETNAPTGCVVNPPAGTDGGTAQDGGTNPGADAGPAPSDGGASADGGSPPQVLETGCACGSPGSTPWFAVLLALGALLSRRRTIRVTARWAAPPRSTPGS